MPSRGCCGKDGASPTRTCTVGPEFIMRQRPSNKTKSAALAFALAAGTAMAQSPTWSFSGYGTLGVVRSDNDQADYLVDAFKPSGPGHSRDWDLKADSRIAGQVTGNLTPSITAVVQVIVQQR